MKKIAVLLIVAALAFSCSKEGEVFDNATKAININGKEYRFIQIVPADGAHGVWILVPKDADVKVPQVTSYSVSCGKSCTRELVAIFVEA